MTEALVAVVVLVALAVPHALPLERVNPVAATAVWLAALALRALLALGLALAALLLLPGTGLFATISGWSVHGFVGSLHVDLSGDPVAHLAALSPPALVMLAVAGFAASLARGAFTLRRDLSRLLLGAGPAGSVVIADRQLLVAVPTFGRGRILLSQRALAELDAAELETCLAHEHGHLRRRHRMLGVFGRCLRAIAWPIPGGAAARRGLLLSLERDADEYAVAETGKPLALASAICKIAGASALDGRGATAMGAAGAGAPWARLDSLMEGGRRRGSRPVERAVLAVAVVLVAMVACAAAGLALWVAHGASPAALAAAITCPS